MRGKISINMAYFPKFSAFFKKRGGGVITGFPPSPLANPILNKPLMKNIVHTAQRPKHNKNYQYRADYSFRKTMVYGNSEIGAHVCN